MLASDSVEAPTIENHLVFCALNTFLEKLKGDEWLSHSSKAEIKNCLQSARNVERMLEALNINDSLECFLSLVPNLFGLNKDSLLKVCDTVLAMVLTAPGVSLPCVHTCVDEYYQLCGSNRFEHVLSSVIFSSEIYRVLLDYLAAFQCDLQEIDVKLQSQLLKQIWKNETDADKLKNTLEEWLITDPSGHNIAVALIVISSNDLGENIIPVLVHLLTKTLHERGSHAVLFWKVFYKLPEATKALEKSSELCFCILDFLKSSAYWMEATGTFTWISREKGPCKSFGFEEMISTVKFLLAVKGIVSERTTKFLIDRKDSVGCTLWDDVDMRLKEY